MRLELEVSEAEWNVLEETGELAVIDVIEGVTVRLRDSLLTTERRARFAQFVSAAVAVKQGLPDDGGVRIQVWLTPE